MVRSILGVIVGYIVMFILQVAAFMTIYTVVGPDWSFKPASFEASTRWTVMQFAVLLVTSIIAGLVCALIARGRKAPVALAVVVLLLGIAAGAATISMKKNEPVQARTKDVPNIEAMQKARHPTWVIFLGPVIAAIGVVVGGKLKRQS